MGVFVDGKERNVPVQQQKQQQQQVGPTVTANIDMALLSAILANTVSDAVSSQIGKIKITSGGTGMPIIDDFDDTKTKEQIAKSMLTDRIDKEANFDNLGSIKTTKKDQKDVDKTIDLLSDLDD